MSINRLNIAELNERLSELIALRDARAEAQTALETAKGEMSAYMLDVEEHGTQDADEFSRLEESIREAQSTNDSAVESFGEDKIGELSKLEALRGEIGSVGDKIAINDGPFVDESDFVKFAEQLANELGSIPDGSVDQWPINCIDWEKAAHALSQDYSTVEWDGTTYLYRRR